MEKEVEVPKEKKNLSTAEEISKRPCKLYGGPTQIYDFFRPNLDEDLIVVLFLDGSQANMTHEEFKKL